MSDKYKVLITRSVQRSILSLSTGLPNLCYSRYKDIIYIVGDIGPGLKQKMQDHSKFSFDKTNGGFPQFKFNGTEEELKEWLGNAISSEIEYVDHTHLPWSAYK